jgi:hypothetical protein
MPDEAWPSPPDDETLRPELTKVLYTARVADAAAASRDRATAAGSAIPEEWEFRRYGWQLDQAEVVAEHGLDKSIHDARVAISTNAIDRAYKGAEFVRLSAGVIATVYTGIAGLTFAAKDGVALPPRGVIPGVFLGLALVLSSAYAAWLTKTPALPAPTPHSSRVVFQARRLNAFTAWASQIALAKAYVLHAAVLTLGGGAVLLPTPFVDVPDGTMWVVAAVFLVVAFVIPLFTARSPAAARTGRG